MGNTQHDTVLKVLMDLALPIELAILVTSFVYTEQRASNVLFANPLLLETMNNDSVVYTTGPLNIAPNTRIELGTVLAIQKARSALSFEIYPPSGCSLTTREMLQVGLQLRNMKTQHIDRSLNSRAIFFEGHIHVVLRRIDCNSVVSDMADWVYDLVLPQLTCQYRNDGPCYVVIVKVSHCITGDRIAESMYHKIKEVPSTTSEPIALGHQRLLISPNTINVVPDASRILQTGHLNSLSTSFPSSRVYLGSTNELLAGQPWNCVVFRLVISLKMESTLTIRKEIEKYLLYNCRVLGYDLNNKMRRSPLDDWSLIVCKEAGSYSAFVFTTLEQLGSLNKGYWLTLPQLIAPTYEQVLYSVQVSTLYYYRRCRDDDISILLLIRCTHPQHRERKKE